LQLYLFDAELLVCDKVTQNGNCALTTILHGQMIKIAKQLGKQKNVKYFINKTNLHIMQLQKNMTITNKN